MQRGRSKEERQLIAQQPMFCVETALKLHRWSQLAYSDYGQAPRGSQTSAGDPSEGSKPASRGAGLVKDRAHAAILPDQPLEDGELCHPSEQQADVAGVIWGGCMHVHVGGVGSGVLGFVEVVGYKTSTVPESWRLVWCGRGLQQRCMHACM